MATKVEKRKVRKQQNLEALGIDVETKPEKKNDKVIKSGIFKGLTENYVKWILFFIEILLVSICLSYNAFK